MRLCERIESFGLILDTVPLPMSSNYITKAEQPNSLLGQSPEHDREIDDVCQMIRNTSCAGIPTLKYNLTLLGVVRTESTRGRGGAEYSTFVYDKTKQEPALTKAGPVDADQYWERITYFLERVVPVAAEYNMPPAISRWSRDVHGRKTLVFHRVSLPERPGCQLGKSDHDENKTHRVHGPLPSP
jgi:mannonate dehydratase